MKMRIIIILIITSVSQVFAQLSCPIQGIWELQPSEGIFKIYSDDMVSYNVIIKSNGDFFIDDEVYGFYVNCNPPILDSLRKEGTGKYFFQISDNGVSIIDGGVLNQRTLNCLSVKVDTDGQDTFLQFGRSSVAEYKKIYSLPNKLINYLKKERPEVYQAYQEFTDQ